MEWLGYPAVDSFEGLDISSLPLNYAWVIANTTIDNVGVYSVNNNCFNCPFKLEKHLKANETESWKVQVSHLATWRVVKTAAPLNTMARNNKVGWLCEMRPIFNEYGVYRLNIGKCEAKEVLPPIHSYLPLLLFMLVFIGVYGLYKCLKYMWKLNYQNQPEQEKALQIDIKGNEDTSLNTFKGLILTLIIFMTTGGGGYPIFNNIMGGLTFAECLFFAYVWSVGVNIPSTMNKAMKEQTKCSIARDIFVKAFILVFLGTVIDSTIEHRLYTTQLWCPLQRMGIAYFIAAFAYVFTVQKFEMKSKAIICKAVANVVSLLWCWIITGFLISINVILISTLISFNCLSNIGIEDQTPEFSSIKPEVSENCNNHFTEYFNKIFVGESQKIVFANGYIGFSRGLMGTVSTIICVMVGLKTGVVYHQSRTHFERFKLWNIWATLFGLGGICFAVLSYPLDFNLLPISSILFISTASVYLFSATYLMTEVLKFTNSILSSFGETSLAILSGHLLFSKSLPFNWEMNLQNHFLSLLQNFWIVFLWMIVSSLLKRRNIKFDF